jgi:DhnA family fructose-bisphosphate aldolase class Ia
MTESAFDHEAFLPEALFEEITDVRVDRPEVVTEEAAARARRNDLTDDGNLMILATDHPARRVTQIRDEPLRMGDRHEYLARIVRVMSGSGFDGVMGTPDMVEELLVLNHLLKERGAEGFLDGKVLLGCMNRGGLNETAFEMRAGYTGYAADDIAEMRMDGGKMWYRLNKASREAGRSIRETAAQISALNDHDLPAFLEPLSVQETADGEYEFRTDYATQVKDLGVGAALGGSSRNLWLKLPYTENFERVSKATTCPILLLGGPAGDDPASTVEEMAEGMAAGANVRGAMIGRNVSFPAGGEDPAAVADALAKVAHEGYGAAEATDHLDAVRGEGMDAVSQYV